jgi:hypothetical protein
MVHDNYYETAVKNFTDALETMKKAGVKQRDPATWHLVHGLLRVAEGLLQNERERWNLG